jgi:hypothetical protein
VSLDGSEWNIDDHRPYISYTQKYTYEQWRSDDKTEEKDTSKMENNPYSAIHPHDIVEVFEEFCLFW